MDSSSSLPRAVVSTNGDVLIIQGSASPILFIPRTHVQDLLEARPKSDALLIDDLGAAAIATFLAAGASFSASTQQAASGEIESVVIRFALPNGIVCVWTMDESFAHDRARLKADRIDLAVTNEFVTWERQHARIVGEMISAVRPSLPQLVSLRDLDPEQLARLVRDAKTSEKEGSTNE